MCQVVRYTRDIPNNYPLNPPPHSPTIVSTNLWSVTTSVTNNSFKLLLVHHLGTWQLLNIFIFSVFFHWNGEDKKLSFVLDSWHKDKCGVVMIDGCFIIEFELVLIFHKSVWDQSSMATFEVQITRHCPLWGQTFADYNILCWSIINILNIE